MASVTEWNQKAAHLGSNLYNSTPSIRSWNTFISFCHPNGSHYCLCPSSFRSTPPPGCQQVPECLEGPPLHLFPGQACNPSPVRLVQCTNLGWDPVLSSPNSVQPTHIFFFFSHQPKKSVSHYESPTHSRALHHLHHTTLAQRNRVFPRGAFGASE